MRRGKLKRALRKLFRGTLFKIVFALFLAAVVLVAVGISVVLLHPPNPAASTQLLNPTGYPVGSASDAALVVYDPGSGGAAKGVASQIASDLQAHGDFVSLAGIDSTTAKSNNTNQYQFIVIGGPIVNGEASSSVQAYLANLTPADGTLIGVFGVGNTNTPSSQIAPLPSNSDLSINTIAEINPSQEISTQSAEFVGKLLS
jgi:sulfite reductase alpha subunit-like flavoprotein